MLIMALPHASAFPISYAEIELRFGITLLSHHSERHCKKSL